MNQAYFFKRSYGGDPREGICAGNRYCLEPVTQVMVRGPVPGHDCTLRWAVCEKHAKPWYFKHIARHGITFELLQPEDIRPEWYPVKAQRQAERRTGA